MKQRFYCTNFTPEQMQWLQDLTAQPVTAHSVICETDRVIDQAWEICYTATPHQQTLIAVQFEQIEPPHNFVERKWVKTWT